MASRGTRLVVIAAGATLAAVPVIAIAQEGGDSTAEVADLTPDHAGPPWAEEGDGPPWGPPPWAGAGDEAGDGEGLGRPPWAEEGDGPPWGPPPWAGPDGERGDRPGRGTPGPAWFEGETFEPGSGPPPWAGTGEGPPWKGGKGRAPE